MTVAVFLLDRSHFCQDFLQLILTNPGRLVRCRRPVVCLEVPVDNAVRLSDG